MQFLKNKPVLAGILVLVVALAVLFFPRGDEPRAYELYERGRWQDAAAAFAKLLQDDPHNWEYREHQARALFEAGDYEAWESKMTEMLSQPKTMPDSLLNLVDEYACFKYQQGSEELALKIWFQAADRGYLSQRPQYHEALLTLSIYGTWGYELPANYDDPLLCFAGLKYRFWGGSVTGLADFIETSLRDVSPQIAWLEEQGNLMQLPPGLRPYALELVDMFSVLKLVEGWQQGQEFPAMEQEALDMLIFCLDYRHLMSLPWSELVIFYPDSQAVTFYYHWFTYNSLPSQPVTMDVPPHGHSSRPDASPQGWELGSPMGELLEVLPFPDTIVTAGYIDGKPVVLSESSWLSGPWRPRVWLHGDDGYEEYLVPAHLRPQGWLEADKIICSVDNYSLWQSSYWRLYAIYDIKTGEIQYIEPKQPDTGGRGF